MTPRLQLLENVVSRINDVKGQCMGALYGVMYDSTLLVIGVSVGVLPDSGATKYQELQTHFPTEIDFCGIVLFTDGSDDNDVPVTVLNNLKDVVVTDNPLLLKKAKNSDTLSSYFYCNEILAEAHHEVISEAYICQLFIHVRLQTRLQLICEPFPQSILEAVNNLQKKVSSGTVAFSVTKTDTCLFGTELESTSPTINQLFLTTRSTEEDAPQKKKNIVSASIQNSDILNVSMMHKMTRDGLSENTNKDAPVILYLKSTASQLMVNLPIDAFCLVHRERKVSQLYGMLVDTLCRSLRLFERCLSHKTEGLSSPKPFHFAPSKLGHFFTVIYQSGDDDENLVQERQKLHEYLNLPMERPVFRRGNAYVFKDNSLDNGPLINPHEGIQSSVKDGVVSTVYGRYSYHHYMQDKMDDNGWGCAYRSLQTLVSWFRHQGYTNRPIPTHREIQQCLVDIGDKERNFVGSNKWIGSTEVSYCLDSMIGISSRILCVSSGSELANKGSELSQHFMIHGTPIMIGGGVLAHTILGVDYNKDTGELKFLVLDPHYTGEEDLRLIQQKGWVGWKKIDFWSKTAYYNLCMPIRPHCI